MFKESNRIILIDDNTSDLEQLSKVFHDNGIGCRTFHYDSFYDTPLKGIKILFLDINLNGAQSDQQRNSTLRDALIHYVHEDNGPFVLVLWTNNAQWIDSFKDSIFSMMMLPLLTTCWLVMRAYDMSLSCFSSIFSLLFGLKIL